MQNQNVKRIVANQQATRPQQTKLPLPADAQEYSDALDEIDAQQQAQSGKNQPVWKQRVGGISCVIFAFEGVDKKTQQKYVSHSVSVQRSYKNAQTGEWVNTPYLRKNDTLVAALLLQKAFEFLALQSEEAQQ